MDIETIKRDLEELETQQAQALANVNAINGAIQYAKSLLARLDVAQAAPEQSEEAVL